MSKAYVGLTTPIGYDYELEQELGYPNPILEGPMGLFILFEEIWFLHPVLCPSNMRDLEYVKFIVDYESIDDYKERLESYEPEAVEDMIPGSDDGPVIDIGQQQEIVNEIWETKRWDNHGRIIEGDFMPMTRSKDNHLLDATIASEHDFELITNTVSNSWLYEEVNQVQVDDGLLELTNRLLPIHLQNYRSQYGPYLERIDDIRADSRVENLRSKISTEIEESTVEEAANVINQEFEEFLLDSGDKRTSDYRLHRSRVEIVTNVFPGVAEFAGSLSSIEEWLSTHKDRSEHGWAGLLANIRKETKDSRDE